MLLPVKRIEQITSERARVVHEFLNPEDITRVCESNPHDGTPCVEVLVCGEWLRCLGTVEEVGRAVQQCCFGGAGE